MRKKIRPESSDLIRDKIRPETGSGTAVGMTDKELMAQCVEDATELVLAHGKKIVAQGYPDHSLSELNILEVGPFSNLIAPLVCELFRERLKKREEEARKERKEREGNVLASCLSARSQIHGG